jgi:hypothetical protein
LPVGLSQVRPVAQSLSEPQLRLQVLAPKQWYPLQSASVLQARGGEQLFVSALHSPPLHCVEVPSGTQVANASQVNLVLLQTDPAAHQLFEGSPVVDPQLSEQ